MKKLAWDKRVVWACFVVVRLVGLLRLPIFNDEAIYLRWARIMVDTPGYGWFSLVHDGKPPLLMWIWGLIIEVIPAPLVVGRMMSVGLGGVCLWGVMKMGKMVGGEKVAWWSGWVYVWWPMAVWFDRMALMEAALAMIVVMSGWLAWRVWEKEWVEGAVGLGLVWGLGGWVKQAVLLWVVGMVGVWLVWAVGKRKWKQVVLAGMAVGFMVAALVPMGLVPDKKALVSRSVESVISGRELLGLPVAMWVRHAWESLGVWLGYGGGLVVLGLMGLAVMVWRKKVKGVMLVAVGLITGAMVVMAMVVNGRYVYPVWVMWLPWLGAGVSWWWSKRKRRVWVGLGVAMNVALVGVMVVAPRVFFGMVEWLPGMKAEAGQVKGWVSGYGVREVVEDIRGLARQGPIVVLVRVDSGNPEDAVLLWLRSEKNVLAVYDWEYVGSEMDQADRLPVYFVSRDGNLGMLEDELMELVKRYDKPGESGGYVGLWKREKRIEPE